MPLNLEKIAKKNKKVCCHQKNQSWEDPWCRQESSLASTNFGWMKASQAANNAEVKLDHIWFGT